MIRMRMGRRMTHAEANKILAEYDARTRQGVSPLAKEKEMANRLTDKKLEGMDTLSRLSALAQRVEGMKYGSKRAAAILDRADWAGVWPVVGRGARYTGDIADSDTPNMANLDDMALVDIDDLKPGSFDPEDGYCSLSDILPR